MLFIDMYSCSDDRVLIKYMSSDKLSGRQGTYNGDRCRGPNASNPARGRTIPGQERPSNGRPDASQRRPGSMLCPVDLPGALSVDILALLLYWPTYAPITVRLTSDTHVAYWQWRPEQISVKLEGQIGINMTFSVKKKCFCMRDIIIIFWGATAMHYLMHRFGIF